MSGGSMDYLYSRVLDATFSEHTSARKALRAHLVKLAKALRAVEWADSGDSGDGEADALIRECLSNEVIKQAATDAALKALAELKAEIERA